MSAKNVAGCKAAAALTEGAQPLRLEGELSVYRSAELKPLMLAALDGMQPTFDLSEVTEIDTAGVQLLLLASREATTRGAHLEFVAASPAVRSAFTLLELDSHLQP